MRVVCTMKLATCSLMDDRRHMVGVRRSPLQSSQRTSSEISKAPKGVRVFIGTLMVFISASKGVGGF